MSAVQIRGGHKHAATVFSDFIVDILRALVHNQKCQISNRQKTHPMKPNSSFKSNPLALAAAAIVMSLLCAPIVAPAAVLFSDDFNTNSSSLWTTNNAPAASSGTQQATFAFDYSPFGIPPAPGSSDTLGLRLRSNIPIVGGVEVTTRPAGATSGLSVSPTGKNFGTSYRMSFYAWINFNGAPNAQGLADNASSEGGTHNILFAVGTSGTVPLVVGNTTLVTGGQMDGIGFATTGDGGIANDYRVYPKSGSFSPTNTGIYAANMTSNSSPYYTSLFPSVSAPAVQQDLSTAEYGSDAFNTQAGLTQAGAFGFAWHKVEITKSNNIVSWTVDDTAMATIDVTSLLPLGGNNIAIGDSDVNTTTTRHPSLLFSLIDNLVVTDIASAVPPTLQYGLTNGLLTLAWPEATAGGFVPQYVESLTPPIVWSNLVATVTTNSGTVSVTVPATNSQRYFRLKL